MRKDSCENARVLLLLVRHSRCTVRRSGRVVSWNGHAPMHTNSVF